MPKKNPVKTDPVKPEPVKSDPIGNPGSTSKIDDPTVSTINYNFKITLRIFIRPYFLKEKDFNELPWVNGSY